MASAPDNAFAGTAQSALPEQRTSALFRRNLLRPDFQDFEDYWSPFLGGQAPAPSTRMPAWAISSFAIYAPQAGCARTRSCSRSKLQ